MKDDRRDNNPENPKDDPLQRIAALERRVAVLTRENERLETFLAVLRHRIFGRSSEKMSPDQLSLLDAAAPAPADPGAAEPSAEPSGEDTTGQRQRGGGGRRPLPDNLPRVTREILPVSTQCPCCRREMARIGQDESKQLHFVPAHAEVRVTVRPKFACRACGELAQAPAPDDRPIERGLPTAGTIAQVVIAKYLNLHAAAPAGGALRPARRAAGHHHAYGWVEAAARDLASIADRLLELLVRRTKIHADDTPVTVLNPGRPGTHDGRFWVYADDTRPRGGSEPSIAVFRFSAGRAGKHPGQHLAGFTGTLQADAFSGFDHLYRGGTMVEAGCLGHARRKLVDLVRAKGSPNRRRGREADCRAVPHRAADIRVATRRTPGGAPKRGGAAARRPADLADRAAQPGGAAQRTGQGARLHERPVGRPGPLRRRRHAGDRQPDGRAGAARDSSGPEELS